MAHSKSVLVAGAIVAAGTLVSGSLMVGSHASPTQPAAAAPALNTACVAKKTGAVRFVSAAAKCAKRERAMPLNLTGAAGQQGVPGAVGPSGPAGPAGATGPTGATGVAGASGDGALYMDSTPGDVKPPAITDFAMPVAALTLPTGSYALEGRLHFQLAGGSPGMCALWDTTDMLELGEVSVPVTGTTVVLGAVTVNSGGIHEVQLRCMFPGTTSYAKDPVLQAITVGSVVTQ